ncbi:zinc finger CCCH domain-containing protein 20-like [Salvia hispanica]|uniref:zinc finger CCCH domain-containing protein 20-like n=1 Tax=Salvia hispanica TaxID=49212 RepID=UPI0020090D73|nr:zinc finger CCCH domain-containing protein 20-like [Salvia hispanica]
MMVGERSVGHTPPWADDPTTAINAIDDYSLFFQTDSLKALQRYLPSNSSDVVPDADSDGADFVPVDAHSCDNFRMFEFKVRKCARGRSHDWTECPFAHPGEKARRRDPRKFHYSGTACPEFRKGTCRKGDACEFSHGVFECWLHPARYRTQPCKDGMACKRRVCFFAHAPDQLRVLSPRAFIASPESVSPPMTESPPMSPTVSEMVASLRQLQLSKVNSMPSSWLGGCPSPRMLPGYFSVPTTPTRAVARPGLAWESEERVESGRKLRDKMFEKLSKENPLDRVEPDPNPDVDWVADLIN